jgi:N-acetylglucosaminyldiphosphoundecaprenol N-acetyl-beta-D-mannosaminyltransferase
MDTIPTVNIVNIPFSCIGYSQVMQQISRWHTEGKCRAISFVNPHSIIVSLEDMEMADALRQSSLILSDGVGIVIASRILGCFDIQRVTGPACMLKICEWSQYYGYSHFFYGGAEGVAQQLAEHLKEKYPRLKVAGTCCPPFRNLTHEEEEQVAVDINSCKPDIVWVGLGAPKQEKWINRHLGKIKATAMIGVGAAFDFHSGRKKWAPQWIRDLGIEWIYRLFQEPSRMWRRNVNNAIFLCCVLGQRMKLCYRSTAQVVSRENAAFAPDLFSELPNENSNVSDIRPGSEPVAVSREDSF